MSGISTGVGYFSGINTGDLINQLIQVESRPKLLAQARVKDLQLVQAGYLDLNTKLDALKSAASAFRVNKIFQTKGVTSSDSDVLSATAGVDAAAGSYRFVVDRLVSSQQLLSRGFANRDTSGLGATGFTFESTRARLDRDTALADLNGGQGIARGTIVITDSTNHTSTIDLSRAVTAQDVLDAINGDTDVNVTASVDGDKFVIKDDAGGTVTVANATGFTTATSLGVAGSHAGQITGTSVYSINANTSLAAINDGNGVRIGNSVSVGGAVVWDFKVTVTNAGHPVDVFVNLGDVYQEVDGKTTKVEGAVTTVGGVAERINKAIQTATTGAGGTPWLSTVSASIDAAAGGLKISDSSGTLQITTAEKEGQNTAADLGLLTTGAGASVLQGKRILAGLNSTLASQLNGGSGVGGSGKIYVTARDGTLFSLNIDGTQSTGDVLNRIASGTNGKVTASLDANGTKIVLTDHTGSTASNLIVEGEAGSDTAASLGISTGATGVASATFTGSKVQKQYVSRSTLLSALPINGVLGTGRIRIGDTQGVVKNLDIDTGVPTVGALIDKINGLNLTAKARINAKGDGIEIYEDTGGAPSTQKIRVEDVTGVVAKRLNLAGEAKGVGPQNTIDGSLERTITFSPADSLQKVATTINGAGVGVRAAVVSDGTGSQPFRLSLAATGSGRAGRFLLDTGAFDLGVQTLDAGEDARLFYGSGDPARGIAVTSSSNNFDALVPGLKIDAKSTSDTPVTLTVTSDTDTIEKNVNEFITSFNALSGRIDDLTKYDKDTDKGGPLLGDGTAIELKSEIYRVVQAPVIGATGTFTRLAQVGITVGTGGDLKLDSDKFRAALAQDAASVESLFAAQVAVDDSVRDVTPGDHTITVRNPDAGNTFTSLGVMSQLEQMVKKYIDADRGVLTRMSKGVDAQIKSQHDRIKNYDDALNRKRELLQAKFTAMEQTLGRLNSQAGALGSIGIQASAKR